MLAPSGYSICMTAIALVTGATRGVGLATARHLGALGVTTLVGARDPEAGKRVAEQLRDDGADAEFLELDVTDQDTTAAARDGVERRHGRLDILVNNAGVLPEASADQAMVPLQLAMFRPTFETNVFGTVAVIEAMLPLLHKSAAGRIVNVSSTLGSLTLQTDPDWPSNVVTPAYQSSKSALNAITVALAKLLTDVTVVSVCPGFVQTDIHPPSNRANATTTPDEAGEFVARVATDPTVRTGTFIDRNGTVPW
jgi:NAD(P)-dependent dehydrogenase (short-subunit alcohol dehydrogenase family)